MPQTIGRTVDTPPTVAPASDAKDYITLGDLVELRRNHARAVDVAVSHEPRSVDDCRLVDMNQVQSFRLVGPERWINFEEMRQALREWRQQHKTNITAYKREYVFAPVKLIIHVQDRPLRAALSYDPIFPRRGQIGIPKPGYDLGLLYAALAMLNSPVGQAFYRQRLLKMAGKNQSRDGLDLEALKDLPIARRGYPDEALGGVADLAYQVSTLYEAQDDCNRDFWQVIRPVQQQLLSAAIRLLAIGETEAEHLIKSVWDVSYESLPRHDQLISPPLLQRLPPIALMADEDRKRFEVFQKVYPTSESDLAAFERIKRLAYWEELVNTAAPRWLETDESAAA
jgi:hypothetical protein